MRFGIFTSLTNTTWDDVLQLWRHTEATGWDAACVTDHFMPNTKERVGNVLECWATLAALAGKFSSLSDAPLEPKPVQRPHPELMIGGGGEKVTLGIVARHADHWNVWGGPDALRRKGRILDEKCAEIGRDPKSIVHSANMPILITDRRDEVDALATAVSRRMGYPEVMVRDLLLAGSVGEVRDKLGPLQDAGVGMVFAPSMFFPKDPRPLLDRFISEVASAFR